MIMPDFDLDELDVLEHIVNVFQDIQTSAIVTVPIQYLSVDSLLDETNFINATRFRMELAGFDIIDPFDDNNCYIITLPVLFPHYSIPPVNFDECLIVYPNPVSTVLTVEMLFDYTFIEKIEVVEVSSAHVVYSTTNINNQFFAIPVLGLNNGLHKVKITTLSGESGIKTISVNH